MKDYRTTITTETADNIISFFSDKGKPIVLFDGVLLDGFAIDIGKNTYKLGNIKLREYLIVHEKYLNEWSSELELIVTDKRELFEEYTTQDVA